MKVNAGQASSTLIPEYIGSDFDKVITVADNIEVVTEVRDNLNHIKAVEGNLGIINTISSNIDEIIATGSNIEEVKSVATNIDPIKVVERNLENIVTVVDNVTDVGNVSANIGYVKNVAEGIEGLPVISYIGEQPPTQPLNGAEWYCTTDGRSYVWYVDNDSGQWVESSPQSDSSKGQHYFGNWNPNEQKYPVSEYYSGLWDVVLNPGQSSVQFDNKTWVHGNKLSYYTDTGIYTQIQTFSEVASVNGYKGAVVLSAADVSADAAGTADSAVSQHEAKQSAHQISGVNGLQAALDFKYSPTNKPSAAAIGADASGTAASAVSVHEVKADAHPISGVTGLQNALDAKASADIVRAVTVNDSSGTQTVTAAQIGSSILFTVATAVVMPTLVSLGGVTGHYRIMAGANPITLTRSDGLLFTVRGGAYAPVTIPAWSDCYVAYSTTGVYVYGLATYETIVKSYCLVNALGTGAPNELVDAALPENITIDTRYVLANPFGANTPVIGWAEIFYNNKWSQTGFIYSSSGSGGYGVGFNYVQGEGIIIQTGSVGLLPGKSSHIGSGHNKTGTTTVTSAPCRVFMQKLGA